MTPRKENGVARRHQPVYAPVFVEIEPGFP